MIRPQAKFTSLRSIHWPAGLEFETLHFLEGNLLHLATTDDRSQSRNFVQLTSKLLFFFYTTFVQYLESTNAEMVIVIALLIVKYVIRIRSNKLGY